MTHPTVSHPSLPPQAIRRTAQQAVPQAAPQTIIDALLSQAAKAPERIACRRIRVRRQLTTTPVSISALLGHAYAVRDELQRLGIVAGDRVVLSMVAPQDFLAGFVGVLLSGAIAVPAPPAAEMGEPKAFVERIRSICRDCSPKAVLLERRDRWLRIMGDAALIEHSIEVPALQGTPLSTSPGDLVRPAPGAPALLQYTSGSTGTPRGVVVTHGNLLANICAILERMQVNERDRFVSWLPLHHDMGLVSTFAALVGNVEAYLFTPIEFMMRPEVWLRALSQFSATISVGPTFAYSLCVRKLPDAQLSGLDLSHVRLLLMGAEPVDLATIRGFEDRFRAFGLAERTLFPVYGLAEATLAVSFPIPNAPIEVEHISRETLHTHGQAVPTSDPDDRMSVVSVGSALEKMVVDVVDPATGASVPDRVVGEIAVSGPSITPGYFGDQGDARQILRTGDLGYRANDNLYIVDRIKDIIIVAGKNISPSDIERQLAQSPDLRPGRIVAFSSRSDAGTEAIHIVAELSAKTRRAPQEIRHEIAKQVRACIQIAPDSVTLVAPGALPRTSSGKIRRRACAHLHQQQGFDAITTVDQLLKMRMRFHYRRGVLRLNAAWQSWAKPGMSKLSMSRGVRQRRRSS